MAVSIAVDKGFALLFVPMAFLGCLRSIRERKLLTLCVAGYFTLLVISSAIRLFDERSLTYPFVAPLLGILADTKPFIFIFFFYELMSRRRCDSQRAILETMHVLVWIAVFNGVFEVRDLIVGGSSIWGIPLSYTSLGLSVPVGLFNHKYPCACLTMIGALACLGLIRERFTLVRLSIFTCLLALLVLNSAFKETVALFVGILVFVVAPTGHVSGQQLHRRLVLGSVMAIVAAISASQISSLVNTRYHAYAEESSVRVALHVASLSIAKNYFPFGSGSGTFASMSSRNIYYSPLYYEYGFSTMYRAGPFDGNFLMDAWWPHVIAEGGFIGCVFYIGVVGCALIRLSRLLRRWTNGSSFFLLTAALAIAINSTAAPSFTVDALVPVVGLVWGFSLVEESTFGPGLFTRTTK